jgi:hypothetical protein
MPKKSHKLEQEATHAQCLALLVEFVKAVRAGETCLMYSEKVGRRSLEKHGLGCAVRRAHAFIRDNP